MSKKGNRIPKSTVQKLLESRGLSMKRKTIKGGRRAWVVSDGKAFHSLRSVYAFYYHEEHGRKKGVGDFLDKVLKGEDDENKKDTISK